MGFLVHTTTKTIKDIWFVARAYKYSAYILQNIFATTLVFFRDKQKLIHSKRDINTTEVCSTTQHVEAGIQHMHIHVAAIFLKLLLLLLMMMWKDEVAIV